LAARREWYEQTVALVEAGLASSARVAPVTAWARSLDARERALEAWRSAGEPQSELGGQGQDRRHHLATALATGLQRGCIARARTPVFESGRQDLNLRLGTPVLNPGDHADVTITLARSLYNADRPLGEPGNLPIKQARAGGCLSPASFTSAASWDCRRS
jgi:hypothetical protein